jgi:DNA-binding NtrC family response regulator
MNGSRPVLAGSIRGEGEAESQPRVAPNPVVGGPGSQAGPKPARLMILDDNPDICATAGRILARAGYCVETAHDGPTALRRLGEVPCDLVITDILMPDMDGLEFISQLRGACPWVKIIMISGGGRWLPAAKLLKTARFLGACQILAKPFSATELLEAVQQALASAGREGGREPI